MRLKALKEFFTEILAHLFNVRSLPSLCKLNSVAPLLHWGGGGDMPPRSHGVPEPSGAKGVPVSVQCRTGRKNWIGWLSSTVPYHLACLRSDVEQNLCREVCVVPSTRPITSPPDAIDQKDVR